MEGPQKMTGVIISIFTTHHLNWADLQTLLNILITADERLVIDKVNQEAH